MDQIFDDGGNQEMDEGERLRMKALTPLNRQLYWMFHHGVLQSILRKYDRLSMAHGVGNPYAVYGLAACMLRLLLPDESKVGGGFTKRILREAMRGVLPEKVRTLQAGLCISDRKLAQWRTRRLGMGSRKH